MPKVAFSRTRFTRPQNAKWKARVDPFSTYRAGFEVRTYRLCQRVLMFHHFPDELGTPDYLVRSTDFTYSYEDNPTDARNPIYSFLDSVSQSGYVRQARRLVSQKISAAASVRIHPSRLCRKPFTMSIRKAWRICLTDLTVRSTNGSTSTVKGCPEFSLNKQTAGSTSATSVRSMPIKTNGKEDVRPASRP